MGLGTRINFVKKQPPAGFTLMEVVVAMVIFTLASVLIAEIFVNVQRAQQQVKDTQVALTELRYLMEVLAREVRSDTIDYSAAGCSGAAVTLNASSSDLKLCSSSNASIQFHYAQDETCAVGFLGGCVQVARNSGAFSTISSPSISIDKLTFSPAPLTNPFPASGADATTPDVQPHVTISLKASTLSVKLQDRKPFYLQTTVTSRVYAR